MGEQGIRGIFRTYSLYFAWIVSLVATGGSLYFSEVLHYEPCKLCWFQRIFMYPQVILLGIACYKNDRRMIPYTLTLSIVGAAIALFHYGQQKVPALAEALPCTVGVPCNQDYINWLGFITIPFLALIAFSLMILFLSLGRARKGSEGEE